MNFDSNDLAALIARARPEIMLKGDESGFFMVTGTIEGEALALGTRNATTRSADITIERAGAIRAFFYVKTHPGTTNATGRILYREPLSGLYFVAGTVTLSSASTFTLVTATVPTRTIALDVLHNDAGAGNWEYSIGYAIQQDAL